MHRVSETKIRIRLFTSIRRLGKKSFKARSVQRKCLRLFLGAISSTHFVGLEQIAAVIPLPGRLLLHANIVIYEILSLEDHLALLFIHNLALLNPSQYFLQIIAREPNNFILLTFYKNVSFKIPYGPHFFRPVTKLLHVKKSTVTPAETQS